MYRNDIVGDVVTQSGNRAMFDTVLDIWIIQIGESLPIHANVRKLRSYVLAEKLVGRGHNVIWWASTFDHFTKEWALEEECEIKVKERLVIKALKGTGYRRNISVSRLIDHRIIAWKFKHLAEKMNKPDIIIASMPPHDLAYHAVQFAKKRRIPVIVDIRDPWPDLLLDIIPHKFRRVARAILFREFIMIESTMKNADSLVAVTKTFLKWGLAHTRVEEAINDRNDRVFYLGYHKPTALNKNLEFREQFTRALDVIENSFVVAFIGTFSNYHNPSILVDCAEKATEENIKFVLAGDGDYYKQVTEKADKLSNVILVGWLDQDEIDTLLVHSDVGVCPTPKQIDVFPNKAFLYLSAGLPVLSSFQGDLAEILEQRKAGFYFEPQDSDALLDLIYVLFKEKDTYDSMSNNASELFDELFSEDKIYEEYAEHVETVAHAKE